MKNSKITIGILLMLIIMLTACASSKSATQQPAEKATAAGEAIPVAIKNFRFAPAILTIKVGDTVAWTNEDNAPHTVESSGMTFKSDELSKGGKYSYTFTKAGEYNYICGIHPSMKGSIKVQ